MGDPAGVEFVVGEEDDAPAEELPDPAPPSRVRGLLIAGTVVILGAGLIVRGASGGHESAAPPSAPSPLATPTARPTVHSTVRPAGCPAGATCEILRTVPPDTVAAVRDAFPRAQLQSAISVVASEHPRFGSPLIARRVAFSIGGTDLSVAMVQRKCAQTDAGDQVTRQFVGPISSTLLVKAVPGDVEGDLRLNNSGRGAEDAYCFLDSILIEQPRGTTQVKTALLDRLAVDEALRSTG